MKKLLVVMLVLATAGVANATLSLTGSADSLTLNASTEEGQGTYYIVILADGTTSTDAVIDLSGAVVSYPGIPSAVFTENSSETGLGDGLGIGIWEVYINLMATDTVTPIDPVIGDLVTGISIAGTGTVNIGFFSGQDLSAMGSQEVVLSIVPEPVTVALLGLGGLFLRRRK